MTAQPLHVLSAHKLTGYPSFGGTEASFFWLGNPRQISVHTTKGGALLYTIAVEEVIQFCTSTSALGGTLIIGITNKLLFYQLGNGNKLTELFFELTPTCCLYVETCRALAVGVAGGAVYLVDLSTINATNSPDLYTINSVTKNGVLHRSERDQIEEMGFDRSTVTCLHYISSKSTFIIGYAYGGFQAFSIEMQPIVSFTLLYSSDLGTAAPPVSHMSSFIDKDGRVVLCVCCSDVRLPYLEAHMWDRTPAETQSSYHLFNLTYGINKENRGQHSLSLVVPIHYQILLEGRGGNHLTAAFVSAEAFTKDTRKFTAITWVEKPVGSDPLIYLLLTEHLPDGTPVRELLTLTSLVSSSPLLAFHIMPEELNCFTFSPVFRASRFVEKREKKSLLARLGLERSDSIQESTSLSSLSFHASALTSDSYTVLRRMAQIQHLFDDVLASGVQAFSSPSLDELYDRALECGLSGMKPLPEHPTTVDKQVHLFDICFHHDFTPLLVDYVTALRADLEHPRTRMHNNNDMQTEENENVQLNARLVEETCPSLYLLPNPKPFLHWAWLVFTYLREKITEGQEAHVKYASSKDLILPFLQEVLVRLMDLETIFLALLKRTETREEGIIELKKKLNLIRVAMQQLELFLWLEVEKRTISQQDPTADNGLISIYDNYARELHERHEMSILDLEARWLSNRLYKVENMQRTGYLGEHGDSGSNKPMSPFIDLLIKASESLHHDTGKVLQLSYPPESMYDLLKLLGAGDAMRIKEKRRVIIYTLMDLCCCYNPSSNILEEAIVQRFCRRFLVETSEQHLVYGLWLLDHGECVYAANRLQSEYVTMPSVWIEKILRFLHAHNAHKTAIEFYSTNAPALTRLEDITCYMFVLMSTSLLEAFKFMREFSRGGKGRSVYAQTLLYILFEGAINASQLPSLSQLPFNDEEEKYLQLFLEKNIAQPQNYFLLIGYFVQRGHYLKAVSYYYDTAKPKLAFTTHNSEHEQLFRMIEMAEQMLTPVDLLHIKLQNSKNNKNSSNSENNKTNTNDSNNNYITSTRTMHALPQPQRTGTDWQY